MQYFSYMYIWYMVYGIWYMYMYMYMYMCMDIYIYNILSAFSQVQHWNLHGRPCGASQTGPCLQVGTVGTSKIQASCNIDEAKTIGKPWENQGKTMGKWWFNGKTIGKPWENDGFMEFDGEKNPLGMTDIAMENGHRNSEFSPSKWCILHSYVKLPKGYPNW